MRSKGGRPRSDRWNLFPIEEEGTAKGTWKGTRDARYFLQCGPGHVSG
jgi:hypothetical protein